MNNLYSIARKARLGALFIAIFCGVFSYAQEISECDAIHFIYTSVTDEPIRAFNTSVNRRSYAEVSTRFSAINSAIDGIVASLSSDASQTVKNNFKKAKNQYISRMMQYIDDQYDLAEVYTLKDSLVFDHPLRNHVKLLCKNKFIQTYRRNGVTRRCSGLEIFIPAEELRVDEVAQGERIFEDPLGHRKWYRNIAIFSSVAVVAAGLLWWASASSFQVA